MRLADLLQFLLFAGAAVAVVWPLGAYMTRVFSGQPVWLGKIVGPFERLIYKIAGLRADREQTWSAYAGAVLLFNILGMAVLFLILVFQDRLPWNPQRLPALPKLLAFNIAASFTTNTDWQSYAPETTLSYFSQMLGLGVQNFLSAATGMAVAVAVIRGFVRKETRTLGNFYVDCTRAVLYVLLPLAFVFALVLVWQGVPMNLKPYVEATTLGHVKQLIAQGPVASQVAIKELGTNGGGFFNANGAHPYENPTPFSNFLELISIVAIAAAFVVMFGRMVGDKRQGRALLACMTILFLALFAFCWASEAQGNPHFAALGIDQTISATNPGGNMEGKEDRFGIMNSALWATLTTATSNGSVNAMHDSFTPFGGLVPLFNMLVGEVIYGGVGCGLYGILIYVLLTVFIAGLMVGRTPEYLGKKIEAYEIKLAVFAMLLYPLCVLGFGVPGLLLPAAAASITAAQPHGLTQALYAYASAAGNNGSDFAGFNADTNYQNIALGIVFLLGRFGVILPVLAIAGSLAAKKTVPASPGTFPTHGLMFVVLLTGVIVMFGGLTYFPALALGPIAEHFMLHPAGL
ncbi:MAG TPA: potassium-transporting ATPase subunit KdpA [Alphaproteobacteria bacterium]|nr:potassium-transporting ATPase subunit KdpA [Alphaproteobacteria bacterium]